MLVVSLLLFLFEFLELCLDAGLLLLLAAECYLLLEPLQLRIHPLDELLIK
jgi:hypothetical protein